MECWQSQSATNAAQRHERAIVADRVAVRKRDGREQTEQRHDDQTFEKGKCGSHNRKGVLFAGFSRVAA